VGGIPQWRLGILCACAVIATSAPPRFSPVSFTAVGDNDYWVLGRVPCHAHRCFSILRTTDGGRSFARLSAPRLSLEATVPTLRFADRLDGFAVVPGAGSALYATHDGGRTWRIALPNVLAFATGGGNAYTVTARCSRVRCTRYRFERSPVAADAWTARRLPFTSDGSVVGLTARGSRVWLLGTRAGDVSSGSGVLARSRDGGRSFVVGRGPCVAGLGGELSPASASVVWAICPTGLLAGAWRSTDGGRTFRHVRTPPLPNAAVLAPASRDTAVLARNGARSRLLRTTDGGATWRAASTPRPVVSVAWIAFTDARVGAALVQTTTEAQALWRTTDGGAHWSRVRLGSAP
jgi:photosystem II stability/assembly factor-like uncharacterized protein